MMVRLVFAMLVCAGAVRAQEEPTPDAPPSEVLIVEGQVTDAVGAGQVDVEVTVHRKSADGSKGELIAKTKSDKLGDFKVTAAKAVGGEVVVTLSKTQFADSVQVIELKEGEVAFVGEALRGNLVVTGRVVNALGKSPVVGAKVQLKSAAAELEAMTDKDGRFRVAGVSPGSMELIVEADRFGRERRTVQQIETFHEKEIILKPDRIVHLKVLDESGKPIAGAGVDCLDQPRTDLRQGATDANGLVTFHGIHFDAATLGVRLAHTDYVSGIGFDQKLTTPADARESTHEFTMVRAGVLKGKITAAASGGGLQGARVFVGENYSDAAPRDFSAHGGSYWIRGVRPGLATVTVHASGYAPELKEVEVKAGQDTTLDAALSAGLVIKGVVKDDKGAMVAGAEVVATAWRSKGTLGLRALSDASGAFRMDDAPADAFEVMVNTPGRPPHTRTLQAGEGVVTVTLPAAASGAPRAGPLSVGEAVPAATVTTLDGRKIVLNELGDKTVLLDFWATWCSPCVEEQAHFVALQEKYGGRKDFLILGISRDHEAAAVREHLVRFPKMKWAQVVGDAAGVRQACEAFGVKSLPEVFLIGPGGKVTANNLRGEAIEKAVDEALKGKSPG